MELVPVVENVYCYFLVKDARNALLHRWFYQDVLGLSDDAVKFLEGCLVQNINKER